MPRPPNPQGHRLRQYTRARAQALWRGHRWELTFTEWQEIWGTQIEQCGRRGEDLSLHRIDPLDGWHDGNVEVTERRRYLGRGPRAKIRNND